MAKNNYLCMRQEEIQGIVSGIGRTSGNVNSVGSGIKGKFAPATNVGLMNNQVKTISKQMGAISNSMSSIQNIVSKHGGQMFDFDKSMAKKVDDIEIPTDFLANNSIEVNQYNRFLLGKIDGRTVNEGESSKEFEEIQEYDVSGENLTNISGNVTELQNYDSSSVIGRSVLGKIDGDVTKLQHYDDGSSVQKSNMVNISGDSTTAQEYDASSNVQKSNMVNISGDSTTAQEYDASSNVQKSAMNDINHNQTEQQSLDESTVIGRSVLGSVNANATASNIQTTDNGSRIAAVNLATYKEQKKADEDELKNLIQYQGVAASTLASAQAKGSIKEEELQAKVDAASALNSVETKIEPDRDKEKR